MGNVLDTLFRRKTHTAKFVHLDRTTGRPEVNPSASGPRRAAQSVVRFMKSRIAEIVTAVGNRANQTERAAKRQEQAALTLADQRLGHIIRTVREGNFQSAETMCMGVKAALESLPQKITADPDAVAQRCAELLLKQLRAFTQPDLVALKGLLTQHVKDDSHPVMKQCSLAASSELLHHQLVSLNLAGEGRWAHRPMEVDLLSHQQRLDFKALGDLARPLIVDAENTNAKLDQTVLPGTGYTQAALKDFAAFGEKAAAELARRASRSVTQAPTRDVQTMNEEQLLVLKQSVAFLIAHPSEGQDTAHLQRLQGQVQDAHTALVDAQATQLTEKLLGKGPFTATGLGAKRLTQLDEDIARVQEKPAALVAAQGAVGTEIDRLQREAQAGFTRSLLALANAPHSVVAMVAHAEQAKQAAELFQALKSPFYGKEELTWIRLALDGEPGIPQAQLKTLQRSLHLGMGTGARHVLAARRDGSVLSLSSLSTVLDQMFPADNTPASGA